jgi:hypothetical protein
LLTAVAFWDSKGRGTNMRCDNCQKEIRPVVAFDIDNTLGNWTGHFLTFLTGYLGYPRQQRWFDYQGDSELSEWLGLDKRTYQDAKLAFRAGGWKRTMPAYTGARFLVDLAEEFSADVWITTTRPWMRLDNVDPDTREWLRRQRLNFKGLLFSEDKYFELVDRVDARRIAFVLEDEFENLDRARDLGLPAYQRLTNWNSANMWDGPTCASLYLAADAMSYQITRWRETNGNG